MENIDGTSAETLFDYEDKENTRYSQAAYVTKVFSKISGLFDAYVVDGLVNGTALFSGFVGFNFKKLQTGKVQTYIVLVVFSIIVLFFIIGPF